MTTVVGPVHITALLVPPAFMSVLFWTGRYHPYLVLLATLVTTYCRRDRTHTRCILETLPVHGTCPSTECTTIQVKCTQRDTHCQGLRYDRRRHDLGWQLISLRCRDQVLSNACNRVFETVRSIARWRRIRKLSNSGSVRMTAGLPDQSGEREKKGSTPEGIQDRRTGYAGGWSCGGASRIVCNADHHLGR